MTDFSSEDINDVNKPWISATAVEDPSPLPTIVGWRLLVRPVPVKEKTQGGIFLPESFRDDTEYLNTVGRVLALGDSAYKHSDFKGEVWCKKGDYVIWPKHVGRRFVYKGVKLVVLEDKNIIMTVPDPAWLDPLYKANK